MKRGVRVKIFSLFGVCLGFWRDWYCKWEMDLERFSGGFRRLRRFRILF